jgi:hypothetical protein
VTTRGRAAVRTLALLALLAAPARDARAQPPAPADDRPAIAVGPFELRPRFRLNNIGVDSNVFNDWEAPREDFTFTVAPDIELLLEPGRLRTTLAAGVEYVYFQEFESERSTNRSFSVGAEADFSRIRPFASYTAAHTSARTGNEIDARARRYPRSLSLGSRVLLASRTSVTLTGRWMDEEYDEEAQFRGTPLALTLNNTTTAIEGAVTVDLTPLTSLSLGIARESTRFDSASRRDSNSLRIAPLLTFSPLGLLNGTASVGYRRFEGLDASLPSYSGVTAAGTLAVLLASRYRVETAFTRDVRYSYEATLPYYVQTGARVSLTTDLFAGLDGRVMAGRETMAYRPFDGAPAPGDDRFLTYGGGFGFRLSPQVQVVVTAEYVERESAADVTRQYENHRIFAALNWGAATR